MNDRTISIERLAAIIGLVKEGRVPDGTYSDDECAAWMMLVREFPKGAKLYELRIEGDTYVVVAPDDRADGKLGCWYEYNHRPCGDFLREIDAARAVRVIEEMGATTTYEDLGCTWVRPEWI